MLLGLIPTPSIRSHSLRRPLRNTHIQLRKSWPRKRNIQTRRIEHTLMRRQHDSEIRVLGQPHDEEHEAWGFDLELGEVGAAGWDAGMLAVMC
jgi:hypothetical protein